MTYQIKNLIPESTINRKTENKPMNMKQILFFLLFICFFSSNGQSADGKFRIKDSGKDKQLSNTYTYLILQSNNGTWCYDIYKDKKILIHQTSIPGIPGNDGFKNKSDAKKVALLVIEKLEKGEMPPSVTTNEMKRLKVL